MEKKIKVYWVVLIILLIISVFVFIETCNSNRDLVQYLSFAGSITSLVLGLIAIFYSIISNQQSTENFGKLNEAVLKIEEGARSISSVSDNINARLDRISDDLVKYSTKDIKEQTVPKNSLVAEREVVETPDIDMPDTEANIETN